MLSKQWCPALFEDTMDQIEKSLALISLKYALFVM